MKRYRRLILSVLLAVLMVSQSAFHVFASETPKVIRYNSTVNSGPGANSGSSSIAPPVLGSDGGPGVAGGSSSYSAPSSNPSDGPSGGPSAAASGLPIVEKDPRLQTTILLNSTNTWSQPFVNDQWCEVGNQAFYSISIFLEGAIGNIHYRAYTSSNGWTNWAMNGQHTSVPANLAPIEAIQIRFSGPVRDKYDIYYTTRLNDGRETGWGSNGSTAGTMNTGAVLGGFRMAFFHRGDNTGLSQNNALVASHADGVQYIGGALRYINGNGSNHTGWGWVDGQRYYFVDSYPVTGWQYIDGYKYYFAGDGKLVEDLEPIIGANGPYLLKINKEMNCLTVYVQDGGNGFIIPLKSFLTSTGEDTPLGTFHTPEKYRWRLMIHDLYTQYATRIGAGLPFLLHSVIYNTPNSFDLQADTYNYLGIARSSGCIRLATADCKWIYDHCPLGTTVEVYNSPIPGPYERPTIDYEISHLQTWDPTDDAVTSEAIAAEVARIQAAN